MLYKLLLPILLATVSTPLSVKADQTNNSRVNTQSNNSEIYQAWCGKIGDFEKSSNRPTCKVQFKNQSIIVDEVLEIPKETILNVKFNLVCTSEPNWDTCQTWRLGSGPSVIEKWGDKRYTINYKPSGSTELKALITLRDWRTDKRFKKDLDAWFGWSNVEKGRTIRNTK